MRRSHAIHRERVREEWFGRLTDKMASIRRTDIMHKSFSKGRPAKTERERNKRRQEAYRWRDARRIYLANSFDKWRKLRSSLGLKDSGLAWHLMEAHEKSQCGICRRGKDSGGTGIESLTSEPEAQEFLPSLLFSLKSLCHSHFQFEDCIKIVGTLCLEFDHEKKENFSVNEIVSVKLLTDSDSKNQNKSCPEVHPSLPLSPQNVSSTKCQNTTSTPAVDGAYVCQDVPIETAPRITPETRFKCETAEGNDKVFQELCKSNEQYTASSEHIANLDCKDRTDPYDCSDSPARNRRMGLNEEDCQMANSEKISDHEEAVKQFSLECQTTLSSDNQTIIQSHDMNREIKNVGTFPSVDTLHTSTANEESFVSSPGVKPAVILRPATEFETSLKDQSTSYNDTAVELPLDMSLIKTEPLKNDVAPVPFLSNEYDDKQAPSFTYSKMKMKDTQEIQPAEILGQAVGRDSSLSKNRCRSKEESIPSIPWQRRDMSRKEEYEFLEMNPFSDLAEFSLRYPHVHQRTYYRWKRRIKEEYIILEQCPDMTFEQFSSVVLQAKEAVFNLWKGLIAQGRGFFAPSTDVSSKKLETKSSSAKPVNNFNAEYLYLQKNLSVTQEQFCRKFPNISPDIFNALQRKVMQEFALFFQNRQLNWQEFSKTLNVSEDVYNCWREHVESMRLSTLPSDMKTALRDFSPNAQMFSSSFSPFLESPSSPADTSSQLSKESMQNSVIDPYGSQPMQIDPALKSSVSRNLSASYLSSLQNMMLPWASYYNLAPPLGQQMLPMMLWPRMLGLASSLAPLNMSSLVSAASCATSASNVNPSLDVLASASRGDFPAHAIKDLGKNESENFPSPKGDMSISKLPGAKRSSSELQENSITNESDGLKKQKIKEEWDGGSSPYSRSRKQNKQEYVYYLKNPELCFKDLETLFPTISVRTFYRWRKEMNAAVLFIEDNRNLDYQNFKLVFPDIPEEVFDAWKTKSGKMLASKSALCDTDSAHVDKRVKAEDTDKYSDESSKSENDTGEATAFRDCNLSGSGESTHTRKICKAAHLFVHQNPDIEFSAFAQIFPNVSVRSFYRWKKEWKDATDFLQTNPEINYETYRSIDASVSKEIFDAWKVSIFSKVRHEEAKDSVLSEDGKKDSKANGHCNRKHNGPEFLYLQLNPFVDFSHFTQIYPNVPSRTFYRWKREIQQILNYVRAQPNISFADISAVLPDVSEEAFHKWRDLIKEGAGTSEVTDKKECLSDTHNPVDEEAKNKMTKALLHLMHNPNIGYNDFHQIFDFVSPETFQLWLHRVKLVVLHISSNPNLNYGEFSSAITDIGEDVFKKWKSLTPEEISAIGTESQDFIDTFRTSDNPDNFDNIKDAMYYCQRYPHVTYDVFTCRHPNISKSHFKQWMLKISDQIAFIKDNPGLTFEDFHKVFEDVQEEVFESWKQKPLPQHSSHTVIESHETKANVSGAEESSGNDMKDNFRFEADYSKQELPSSQEESAFCHIDTDETHSISSQAKASKQGPICHEKENEGASVESSLSKLTKFAESDVSLYTRWTPGHCADQDKLLEYNEKSPLEHETLSSHSTNDPSFEQSFCKSHMENDADNNNVHFNGLYKTGISKQGSLVSSNVNKLLNPLSTNISVKDVCSSSPELNKSPLKYEQDIDDFCSARYKHLASENKSLSALMVMSTNKNQLPLSSSNFKQDFGNPRLSHSSSSVSWNSGQISSKEDDEIFSSQRQKKMSRAEYLFVKDNPDVDSQEFSRIFPGVSARTFYRWKKEIKAQIQIP